MRHPKALTLIEIMVTLAIVSILTVGALSAVSGMTRSETAQAAGHRHAVIVSSLRNLIEADILHATDYETTPEGFVLQTMVLLDHVTMRRRHLPVAVEYQIRLIGERSWLVRIQRPALEIPDSAELVWPGVTTIDLAEQYDSETESDQLQPTAYSVSIDFEDEKLESFSFTVRRE